MNQDIKHKAVDSMLMVCMRFLASKGLVSAEQFDTAVITRCDMDDRLASEGKYAAASIDDIGRPVVIFHSRLSYEALSHAIPHEAVHLAQLLRGDWEPYQGYSVWQGKRYENLPSSDPDYNSLEKQPWEHEAKQWETTTRGSMLDALPALQDLIHESKG